MHDKKFLDMMNKAENLLSRLDFDTEFIDSVVGDNDEVIKKRNLIMKGISNPKPTFSKTTRVDAHRSRRNDRIEALLERSTEMLSISPKSGFKKLNGSTLSRADPVRNSMGG